VKLAPGFAERLFPLLVVASSAIILKCDAIEFNSRGEVVATISRTGVGLEGLKSENINSCSEDSAKDSIDTTKGFDPSCSCLVCSELSSVVDGKC
jgi:hypothetical protein